MNKPKYTDYKTPDGYYEACCEYAIMRGSTGNEDSDSYYYDDYYDDGYDEEYEYEIEEENKWREN